MSVARQCLLLALLGILALAGGFWVGSRRGTVSSHEEHQPAPGVQEAAATLTFEEVQEAAGIRFQHFDSPRASLLPEDVGSGAGWADYDLDGDEDLYLVNFAGPFLMDEMELAKRPGNRLFRNDGGGKFTDVTDSAGVGHVGWDYGCLWFDYDGDGRLDLAITRYDGVILYRNRGDGSFEDRTAEAKLSDINRFLLGLAAADYDRDGDLDLYLCGYVTFDREAARNRPMVSGRPAVWTNPVSYPAVPNILLRNEGNGTFADVSETAGVANPDGKGMQAVFCDFDNDSWPDLYVGNDVGTADVLFHNRGDGTFEDVSMLAGTHDRRATMGLAVGDVWRRGWMDLFATHWVAEDHALWKNSTSELAGESTIRFEDLAPAARIVGTKLPAYVGWGTGLVDFDNDGRLDILLVNGSTIEDELTIEVLSNPKLMPQPPQVLWNDGQDRFVDVGEKAGAFFGRTQISRGLAFADYDQDGRVDAVSVTENAPTVLLHNSTPQAGHWVQVRLQGSGPNRFAVGARVRVTAAGVTQTREVAAGGSYLSTNSYLCHFGVGSATKIETLEVAWPSGAVSKQSNVAVDRILTIVQPEAAAAPAP